MPQTIRKYWGAFSGRVSLNYNWPAIDRDSVVTVTVSEYGAQNVRFVGAASIEVANVAPHGPPWDVNHGVSFIVDVKWDSPLNIVTDITVWDSKRAEPDYYTPPQPINIGLRMQYQEADLWCWIAVAASINHFYNPASTATQCSIMTTVGQNINKFPTNTSACPSAAAIARTPGLAAILADPYNIAALFALEDPSIGIDRRYLKSGGVSDALDVYGNSAGWRGNDLSLDQIAGEVNAGRPVIATIKWNDTGGEHFVAIAGVFGDGLLILDPINGQSVVRFGSFPGAYYQGGTLADYCFTKIGT
jgi:hypothetical protein